MKIIGFRKLVIVFFLFSFSLHAQQLELKVGSYNIRYDNQEDREQGNSWTSRLPVLSSLLRWESPDVFGAQEVLADQLQDMKAVLPDYAVYGVGRADGKEKGEYAPIFFKKDKFELLKSGEFWLSETPEKPSKGWDAALPRICTWVKLAEKNTGKEFWFFNLHMDHVGVKARKNSSKLVLRKIKELAQGESSLLTGDFNVDQHNANYDILNDADLLEDAYEIADDKMAWNGTFNAFKAKLWTDSRIDHIFVTKGVSVSNYAVMTETYRSENKEAKPTREGDAPEEIKFKKYDVRLPSDHFPIFAKIKMNLD